MIILAGTEATPASLRPMREHETILNCSMFDLLAKIWSPKGLASFILGKIAYKQEGKEREGIGQESLPENKSISCNLLLRLVSIDELSKNVRFKADLLSVHPLSLARSLSLQK